jgi:hypothetical protein
MMMDVSISDEEQRKFKVLAFKKETTMKAIVARLIRGEIAKYEQEETVNEH